MLTDSPRVSRIHGKSTGLTAGVPKQDSAAKPRSERYGTRIVFEPIDERVARLADEVGLPANREPSYPGLDANAGLALDAAYHVASCANANIRECQARATRLKIQAEKFALAIDALPVGKDIRNRLHAHVERLTANAGSLAGSGFTFNVTPPYEHVGEPRG